MLGEIISSDGDYEVHQPKSACAGRGKKEGDKSHQTTEWDDDMGKGLWKKSLTQFGWNQIELRG